MIKETIITFSMVRSLMKWDMGVARRGLPRVQYVTPRLYSSNNSLMVINNPFQNITNKDCLDDDELELQQINPLSRCEEDLSDVAPYMSKTFNFAAYIDKSQTLQNLVKLGVDLHKIEKRQGGIKYILKLDFEKDIKKIVFFLNDYVEPELLGKFLTKNPFILRENLDNLQVRVNYLESKRFDTPMIKRIVSHNPFWLMFSTVRIDKRLGHFQKEFKLSGKEVRQLSAAQPRLITYSLHAVEVNHFTIKEEMGFQDCEIKKLLLEKPKLLMMNQLSLVRRFQYLHNVMKISHRQICDEPGVLFCREYKVRQRHTFLEKLGRARYDRNKENYVPLIKLVEGTDVDFCREVAKCHVVDYNLYLKTL